MFRNFINNNSIKIFWKKKRNIISRHVDCGYNSGILQDKYICKHWILWISSHGKHIKIKLSECMEYRFRVSRLWYTGSRMILERSKYLLENFIFLKIRLSAPDLFYIWGVRAETLKPISKNIWWKNVDIFCNEVFHEAEFGEAEIRRSRISAKPKFCKTEFRWSRNSADAELDEVTKSHSLVFLQRYIACGGYVVT